MKKILYKVRLLWKVLTGNSITMIKDKNCLIVDAGKSNEKDIREAATQFFKEAYLLSTQKL